MACVLGYSFKALFRTNSNFSINPNSLRLSCGICFSQSTKTLRQKIQDLRDYYPSHIE
jgi:hypothetical protein